MKHLLLFKLIGALLIISCSNSNHGTLPMIEINGKQVPILKFNEVRDTISLSLSQLLDDVSFIRLETKDEYKLSGGKWSIGEKYIVGYCRRSGMFQYTSDGKFIRKFSNFGKGPLEVYYPNWTISKDESHIYIYDLLKPKNLLCFDLDSGLFTKNIPISLEGQLKNICLINDSVLVCAPIIGTGEPASDYYIFWQNLAGKFIKGIPARNITKPTVPSENILYRVGNYLHYRPVYGDTIFQLNDFQMEPCFIFEIDKKLVNPENDIGHTKITVLTESPDFILIETYTINSKDVIGENTIGYTGKYKYYFINKLNKSPYLINSFYNDFTGEKLRQLISFEDQISDLKYISIDAFSLLKKINRIKLDSGIKVKSRDAFINLGVGMTENDNPVLLVGKFVNN